MINKNVMDRLETLEHLKAKWLNNERIIVPRYNDGEYMLMNKLPGHVAQDSFDIIPELLINAIRIKGQLVCINYLKPHNVSKKDVWFRTQEYLMEAANQELYGCGNWSVYDFSNNNELLPHLFSGNALLAAGLVDSASEIMKLIQPDLKFFKTPIKNAADKYEDLKAALQDECKDYDTILFSCGPIGKVLIADLIDVCDCNLIDIGAVLNAILDLTDQWPMSWAKNMNIEEKRKQFYTKLGSKSRGYDEIFNASWSSTAR